MSISVFLIALALTAADEYRFCIWRELDSGATIEVAIERCTEEKDEQ